MYDKSRFLKGTGASFGVVAIIGIIMVSTGTAFAVPMGGIGGFTITADEIRAEGAFIYPGSAQVPENTENASVVPVGVTELQSSEIDGLYLNKTTSIPGGGRLKFTITATDTVTTGQQVLKFTRLEAEKAVLRGQVIQARPPGADKPQFSIDACGEGFQGVTVSITSTCEQPDLVLKDVTIQAQYLATDKITLPGQKIIISWDKDGDGDFETVLGE